MQKNLLRMRDPFIHTNCLATLSNMAAQVTHLHSYAGIWKNLACVVIQKSHFVFVFEVTVSYFFNFNSADRMLSLLHLLSKKYLRLETELQLELQTNTPQQDGSVINTAIDNSAQVIIIIVV